MERTLGERGVVFPKAGSLNTMASTGDNWWSVTQGGTRSILESGFKFCHYM